MSADGLEIEVKFLVSSVEIIRQRLERANATLEKPHIYERNIRFDTDWQGLMRQGKLLRLRQDSVARITYKGEPEQIRVSEARIREEIEMEVADFDTAAAIFEKIGFQAQQVYEKYRETHKLDQVEVVLDELPFGEFIELEGGEAAIMKVAGLLELDWSKRILANYLSLMQQLKTYHDLPFDVLTFENFAGQPASMSDLFAFAD